MGNNLQQIDSIIKTGYSELEDGNVQKACEVWLEAWEGLKELNSNEAIKSIEEFNEGFQGFESFVNWCQDFEMELENAALENKEFFKTRIKYCKEFYELLPDSDEFIIMSMLTAEAESYFDLGDIETSERLFKEVSKEFDDYVWPFIKWGDVYWLSNIIREDRSLLDLDKAESIYKKVLGQNLEDEHLIKERLKELEDVKSKLKK